MRSKRVKKDDTQAGLNNAHSDTAKQDKTYLDTWTDHNHTRP